MIPEDDLRRAVDAALKGVPYEMHLLVIGACDAYVKSLTSDVCPTCGGRGDILAQGLNPVVFGREKCPDCQNGKVPQALYTRKQYDEAAWVTKDTREIWAKKVRAEVIAELERWLRAKLEGSGNCVTVNIDGFVSEFRERDRND